MGAEPAVDLERYTVFVHREFDRRRLGEVAPIDPPRTQTGAHIRDQLCGDAERFHIDRQHGQVRRIPDVQW